MAMLHRWAIARVAAALLAATLPGLALPPAAGAATPKYPNLKSLTPTSLQFDTETINGSSRWVLRFSNTVWNADTGALELRARNDSATTKSTVFQRVYNTDGTYTDYQAGVFDYHPAHNHFHFGDFAEYELWTRAEYDRWVASGRATGQAQRRGSKTTFCIMDTRLIKQLPGSPSAARYSTCNDSIQGLSVGWGDIYGYHLAEQWIDLGTTRLADGRYALRTIADPKSRLRESDEGDNDAVRFFRVAGGAISYE
jgi:hypothetical protein